MSFLSGSVVKNLPAMQKPQETWIQSLGQEDPLEEGMATHTDILAWRIPMHRGAWQATVPGVTKSQTRLSTAQGRAGKLEPTRCNQDPVPPNK